MIITAVIGIRAAGARAVKASANSHRLACFKFRFVSSPPLAGLAGSVTGPAEAVIEPTAILGGATIGGASGLAMGLSACKTGGGSGSGGGGSGGGKHGTFWKNLKSFRRSIKTDGQRFYEWDYTHGDVEVYNSQGKHLGSADPETGQMTKPPIPGRTIDL